MSDETPVTRRDFLVRTGKAAGLAAAATGLGFALHAKERHPFSRSDEAPVIRDLRVKGIAPKLVIAHGEDPAAMTRACIERSGGMRAFVTRGDAVLVKPNIGWDRMPEQAADTNPDIVREIIRLCLDAGASTVLVTDVSCNETERCFLRSGIAQAAEDAGAAVVRPKDGDFTEINMGGAMLGRQRVQTHYLRVDKVINVPIAKHHSLTGATLAMKNLYGILGGNRSRLHQDVHNSLADLHHFLRPTLTILDAYRVLRRNGPQGGNLADVEMRKTIVASTDMLAIDAYAGETLFSLPVERLKYLSLAAKQGLGTPEYRSLPMDEFTV